jgi:hypothetical protein
MTFEHKSISRYGLFAAETPELAVFVPVITVICTSQILPPVASHRTPVSKHSTMVLVLALKPLTYTISGNKYCEAKAPHVANANEQTAKCNFM